MIPRHLGARLRERLAEVPAVVLTGPRQVGKTTLALAVAQEREALYLDLESERDRAKLAEPELYLEDHLGRLVILDEVHRTPGLFPVLRGLIDRARQRGERSGLYLLLGSASLDLLRQSGETLAGRVSYLELTPIGVRELPPDIDQDVLWAPMGRVSDGERISFGATWSVTYRSSGRGSPPRRCGGSGPCSPTTRAAC
jgi:predicted AAA+ superfamily ATPase